MSENLQQTRATGYIKSLLLEKRSGWISPDDHGQDLYFLAKEVENNQFDVLKKGDLVTFVIRQSSKEGYNFRFANNIKLISNTTSTDNNYDISNNESITHSGYIVNLIREKKAGFITPEEGVEDLYFIARQVQDNEYENLEIGMFVKFNIGITKDGERKFANNIRFKFIGYISNLFKEKNTGLITSEILNHSYFFNSQSIEDQDYQTLQYRMLVIFSLYKNQEGNLIAYKINCRFQGYIVNILENCGWIKYREQDKDLYFLANEVENDKFSSLKQGDFVSFTIGISKKGKKFANRIRIEKKVNDNDISTNSIFSNYDFSNNNVLKYQDQIINIGNLKQNLINLFNNLFQSQKFDEFEDSVFLLLRLLGIHSLYQYDKKHQAGRADGFFIISSLAVMYDCTLRESFELIKKDQIENYVNRLEQSQLIFDIRLSDGGSRSKTLKIDGKTKQVWIITKGKTKEIADYGDIKVKQVSIYSLIKLLELRLNFDTIEETDFALNMLSCIEKID